MGCALPNPPGTDAKIVSEEGAATTRLRAIEIETRNVFSDEEAHARPLYRILNGLHVPTREPVVRRELWLAPGDRVAPWEVEEVERRLRQLGLFGEVEATLEPTDTDGESVLRIDTRDRLSITTGAGGFFVGGVGGFQASLGDRNLLGTGNRISASYSVNSEDEERGNLSFTDTQFLETLVHLRVAGGFTEEGSQASVGLQRAFQHDRDPEAWGATVSFVDNEVDYFEDGETVAEVPRENSEAHLYWMEGVGGERFRDTSGVDLRVSTTTFGNAAGSGAGSIDVPGDTDTLALGWIASRERRGPFLQREGIDAIDYVEDIQTGSRWEWYAGLQRRAEAGQDDAWQPLGVVGYRRAHTAGEAGLWTLSLQGTGRFDGSDAVGWSASGALHGYYLGRPGQTWAASLSFDQAVEDQGLPVQLTLGEDNGLRGYPSREFEGDRRLRFNLENRIQTDWRFRSVHLGVVPFFDAGWIGEDSLGSARTSVGVGLRFGSSELFGRGVLRLDFAVPLDEAAGESFDPSLSFSLGQVFSLFGNASALRGQ